MKTALIIFVAIAMLATFGVLIAGVLGMGSGESGSARGQALMRWRVLLQGAALLLFGLLLLLTRG